MRQEINLLPWREMARQKRRRLFFLKLAGTAAVTVVIVGGAYQWFAQQLNYQYARNDRVQQEITILNRTLREFSNKKVARDKLQHRLELVNALQKQRNNPTLLFNILPDVMPEGVVLDKVSMYGKTVSIEGRSKSNAQLANLLAKLEESQDVAQVQMHSIVNKSDLVDFAANQFRATFQLTAYVVPELPTEENNGV